MSRKLILFDIDGTIVSYQGKTYIPDLTLKAIEHLRQNGHLVAVASGRSLLTAKNVMDELKLELAVLHNGARIVNKGETIYKNKISKEISNKLCQFLLDTDLCVFAFDEESVFVQNISEETKSYFEELTGSGKDLLKPLHPDTNGLYSVNVYGDTSGISYCLADYNDIAFSRSMNEITAKNVSKGEALITLSKEFDIDLEDTIAVGDGLNDVEMLRHACIGIAVGNACMELKKAADIVTDNIEDGGVYKAFKELKLI